jgi:hypothetical protein
MRDEDGLTDAERRLRAVLRPTVEGAAAVASRALAPPGRATSRRRAALMAAVTLTLLLASAVVWRASTRPQPALHIWGSGSVVVVTRDDGRRWVVDGGHEPAPTGQYVIVVPQ